MRTNSRRNGPRSTGAPSGSISRSSVERWRPCSSSFEPIMPSVSRVAQTSLHAHLAQQIRERADVVLVGVREHDGAAPRGPRGSRSRAARGRRRGARHAGTRGPRRRRGSRPAISNTVMFFPTSPRPPSGITRNTESVIKGEVYGDGDRSVFPQAVGIAAQAVHKSPVRGWHRTPARTRTTCMRRIRNGLRGGWTW